MLALAIGLGMSFATARGGGSAVPQAGHEALVRIAARHLPRGTVLTESDMTVARAVVRGVSSSGPSRAGNVGAGWITRRVIRAGEVLQPPAVRPAPLIANGQAVQFTLATDGVTLTVPGIALSDADAGEELLVRLDGRRRLRGVATGPARVVARPPRTPS